MWPCIAENYLPTSRVWHPVEKRFPKSDKVQQGLAVYSEGFATEPISPRCMVTQGAEEEWQLNSGVLSFGNILKL